MGPHKLSSKQQAVPAHTAQLAAALAACGVAVLATLPQLQGPELTVGAPPRTNLQTEATQPLDTPRYSRVTTTFRCQGDECEAWLYLPKGLPSGSLPPVVIMGHGMGGQKDFGLHVLASKFADAGLAAFVFDYRGFGGSSGEWHWISARRHMADWRDAIRHVRSNLTGLVDTSKLALWGTSFAGGHVLVMASEREFAPHVSAVVAQVPNLDAAASTRASIEQRGVGKSLRMLLAGITDLLRTSIGLPPVYLPIAGLHGSMAFMQLTPSELERYNSNHPAIKQGGWQNRARAAYAVEHALFKTSPIKHVAGISAPVLFCGAQRDALCPMAVIERAVAATPRAQLYAVDCNHFELFMPQHLPALQMRQLDFLLQHLGGAPPNTPASAAQ